jgi:hypothetical protein
MCDTTLPAVVDYLEKGYTCDQIVDTLGRNNLEKLLLKQICQDVERILD